MNPPWKFYGLTEAGRTFFDEYNLIAAGETLQRIYETISNNPEEMINQVRVRASSQRILMSLTTVKQ